MIRLSDFTMGYEDRILLDKVTAEFSSGTLTALIGRNGTGKSTLLRALCGLGNNWTGGIEFGDKDIRNISAGDFARRVSFVNPGRPRIANLRCFDVVALGRAPYTDWVGRLSKTDKELVEKSLHDVGMTEYASRMVNTLSDGECQRVMIARALAQDTSMIILDEPTSFLDLPNRYEIVSLLSRLVKEEGKTVIFSTHELDIAIDLSDEIALIDGGELHVMPVEEMVKAGLIQNLFKTPGSYVERLLKMIMENR